MTTAERVVHKGVHEAPRSPFDALKYRMFVSVLKSVGPISELHLTLMNQGGFVPLWAAFHVKVGQGTSASEHSIRFLFKDAYQQVEKWLSEVDWRDA